MASTIWQNFTDAYRKFAVFSGRSKRRQYWEWFLLYFIASIGFSLIDVAIQKQFFSIVFAVITFIPSLSIACRRLHDTGRSGWWQLLYLIPLIGPLVLIYFLCQRSENDNQYGPDSSKPGPSSANPSGTIRIKG